MWSWSSGNSSRRNSFNRQTSAPVNNVDQQYIASPSISRSASAATSYRTTQSSRDLNQSASPESGSCSRATSGLDSRPPSSAATNYKTVLVGRSESEFRRILPTTPGLTHATSHSELGLKLTRNERKYQYQSQGDLHSEVVIRPNRLLSHAVSQSEINVQSNPFKPLVRATSQKAPVSKLNHATSFSAGDNKGWQQTQARRAQYSGGNRRFTQKTLTRSASIMATPSIVQVSK